MPRATPMALAAAILALAACTATNDDTGFQGARQAPPGAGGEGGAGGGAVEGAGGAPGEGGALGGDGGAGGDEGEADADAEVDGGADAAPDADPWAAAADCPLPDLPTGPNGSPHESTPCIEALDDAVEGTPCDAARSRVEEHVCVDFSGRPDCRDDPTSRLNECLLCLPACHLMTPR